MYHCKRQPWNAGGPSEDTDSGGLSWPVQALEMESTSGVLMCENSAGVWGDMTDPSNDGHSPYLQPPCLQAPLHPDAQWPLSARRCSLLGSAPLRAVASTCPARLHTCSPLSPTCLAEWSTAPGEPSQAARLAGGSGRCHFLLCHYVSPARLPALRPCLDLIPQHGPLSPSFPSHRGEKGSRRWTGCIIKGVQGRGTGVGT